MRPFLAEHRIPLIIALTAALAVIAYLAYPLNLSYSARIDGCMAQGDYKEQCYQELVMEAAHDDLSVALDLLGDIYTRDVEFASSCHGSTHELGKIAYERFSTSQDVPLSAKTSYCGFGFFHGFLEGLFETTGDLAEARRFCEYVDEKLIGTLQGVSFACYHGIGHGVVDGTDPELWNDAQKYIAGGLALCDTLSGIEEHQERCASGVFNALAIAYGNPKFSLGDDPKDPFAICRKQEKRYAREACYDQMNGYLAHTNPTFKEALTAALSAEEEYRAVAVHSLAAYYSQLVLSKDEDISKYVLDCNVLPFSLNDECAQGFAVGMIEFGSPGKEFERALDVCTRTGDRSPACIRGVITSVRDRLPPDAKESLCRKLSEAVSPLQGEECDRMMQSS